MSMETIIFDFGGVRYKLLDRTLVGQLKTLFGLEEDPAILKMLTQPRGSDLMRRIFVGQVSEEAMWDHLVDEQSLAPNLGARFKEMAFSPRQLDQEMAGFLTELQQPYQTAILSSTGDQSPQLMVDGYHLDRWVEPILISAEEG